MGMERQRLDSAFQWRAFATLRARNGLRCPRRRDRALWWIRFYGARKGRHWGMERKRLDPAYQQRAIDPFFERDGLRLESRTERSIRGLRLEQHTATGYVGIPWRESRRHERRWKSQRLGHPAFRHRHR